VLLAVTATASPRVQADIQKSLDFGRGEVFIASFDRPNLYLEVQPKANPLKQTIDFIRRFPEKSGIIYCLSRRQVDELTENLKAQGCSVLPYHAGLSDQQRMRNQDLFIKDKVQLMIATIAFGMGINKPDVRFILHYDLPQSIDHYYQQIGRAGRDGLPAHCLLLFGYQDIQKVNYLIQQKESETGSRIARIHLNTLVNMLTTKTCRRRPILKYFGEESGKENCQMCDNCCTEKQKKVEQDITPAAKIFFTCVASTNQTFGAHYLIDVLRGAEIQKIRDNNHHCLAIYGSGKGYSKKEWLHFARQFMQKGLLLQDAEYGSLKLTRAAQAVLKNQQKILGTLAVDTGADTKMQAAVSRQPAKQEDYDIDLFALLKKQREILSRRENVPPYVIFPDRTLMEISAYYPQSRESLLALFGVGLVKAEKYGEPFLEIVRDYSKLHHLAEKNKVTPRTEINNPEKKKKCELIGMDYNQQGLSLQELVEKYRIKERTVIDNLYDYMALGHTIRPEALVKHLDLDTDTSRRLEQAFADFGTSKLKPVYEALQGSLSYDILQIYRLYYLNREEKPLEV
jgi:ATP-dependent DNA helicase RecQ